MHPETQVDPQPSFTETKLKIRREQNSYTKLKLTHNIEILYKETVNPSGRQQSKKETTSRCVNVSR